LTRDGVIVAESSPIKIFVAVSPANFFLGYCMPIAMPIIVFIERPKRTSPKLESIGIVLGGYSFFALGLMICQSLFLIVPIAMQLAGCYIGILVMQRVYDMPLPGGYEWHALPQSCEGDDDHSLKDRILEDSFGRVSFEGSNSAGIERLRDLFAKGEYCEAFQAAYALVVGTLCDLIASSERSAGTYAKKNMQFAKKDHTDRAMNRIIKELKRHYIGITSEKDLIWLERQHHQYVNLTTPIHDEDVSSAKIKRMAWNSIEIAANVCCETNKSTTTE
jgi:ATP-dependent protease HslVU (ClpYQ) peptidase subunit